MKKEIEMTLPNGYTVALFEYEERIILDLINPRGYSISDMKLEESEVKQINNITANNTCWSCGHFLIGGGCWKDGQMGEEGWKNVSPNDSCEHWVKEGTKGTITGDMNDSIERGDKLD